MYLLIYSKDFAFIEMYFSFFKRDLSKLDQTRGLI